MMDLAVKSLDYLAASPRDALLVSVGLVSGFLLWQVERQMARVRDRWGRRD
jgi:hypothetical protein